MINALRAAGFLAFLLVIPYGLDAAAAVPPGLTFADSGIVNLKTDAGAKGDGKTDDTAVFKEVFGAGKDVKGGRFGAARYIYIPAGTYLIREPIVWGDKKKFVRGDGMEHTIIRLADRSPAFADAKKPTALLDTRGKQHFAQNFLQRVVDLTIDVGRGNPGAIGLEYHTNNIGGIYNLRIRSSDPQGAGAIGLGLNTGPGPGLVWNVAIEGFEVGIQSTHSLHSMTLANINLRGQRRAGIECLKQSLFFSNVDFQGDVPLLILDQGGTVTMAGVKAVASKRVAAAIEMRKGSLVVRDLVTSGFGNAINGPNGAVSGPTVERHASDDAVGPFPQEGTIPNLPIVQPPIPDYEPSARWAVIDPGPELSADVQRAIDGGARTVFIKPGPGQGQAKDTIVLRHKVERIIGFGTVFRSVGDWGSIDSPLYAANIGKDGGFDRPLFRVEDGAAPAVIIEFLHDEYGSAGWKIDHASTRPLVVLGFGASYRNTVPGGSVFLLDTVGQPLLFDRQHVWGWQINTESYNWNPHIRNQGGTLWLCGHKIEKDRTNIATVDGGWTELNGGFYYKNRERVGPAPALVVSDSTFSGGFRTYGQPYPTLVEETRDGEMRRYTNTDNGGGSSITLFETRHEASLERHRAAFEKVKQP